MATAHEWDDMGYQIIVPPPPGPSKSLTHPREKNLLNPPEQRVKMLHSFHSYQLLKGKIHTKPTTDQKYTNLWQFVLLEEGSNTVRVFSQSREWRHQPAVASNSDLLLTIFSWTSATWYVYVCILDIIEHTLYIIYHFYICVYDVYVICKYIMCVIVCVKKYIAYHMHIIRIHKYSKYLYY